MQLPVSALTTYQLGFAVVFLVMAIHLDGIDAVFSDTRAWIGLVFGLGICGTGLAYILYYYILANLGALAASSVTYIPPIVSLVIGILVAGESIDALECVAVVFVLAGVAALQLGKRTEHSWRAKN
ncbi:EamA family transporter [Bradyrhizobium vignae]|uniref:EamA family transporter n=1 Tax=Bradyrhizobium vignae TaxID=1549949 RepID=UPI001ABFDDA5|nr:EamA family transporter [Bradyrhizobium vignae]